MGALDAFYQQTHTEMLHFDPNLKVDQFLSILDEDLHKSTQILLAPIVWEGELETSPEGIAGEGGEGVAVFCIFNASKAQGTGSLNCSLSLRFLRGMARNGCGCRGIKVQ